MGWIDDRVKGALALADEYEETQSEKVEPLVEDAHRVSDAEFAMWFEMKIGLIPAPPDSGIKVEPFDYYADVDQHGKPIGPLAWRNIWIEHLEYVEGGKDLLRRYERAKAKQYETQMALQTEVA